ncbi:MAG: GIY-YIG nuclease family protein [Terracidiphilus sp.]
MLEDLEEEAMKPESRTTPILIRTYGRFWNPELVNWNNSWRLLGKRRLSWPDVNVYEERGVYVLYKDYVPVYVGKADQTSIGYRLQMHRHSRRKGPRWDQFSWFGVCGLTKSNKLLNRNAAFHPKSEELIATLEALLIVVIEPKLNARSEKFRNAVRLFQSETDRPPQLGERLESIEGMLTLLLKSQGAS